MQSNPRFAEAVRFGFEREGADVVAADSEALNGILAQGPSQLIIAGGADASEARSILKNISSELQAADQHVPVLYLGNGISRVDALHAGATEFLKAPAFIRDVVTVGMLLASPRTDRRPEATKGELANYFGLYYIVRAMSAVRQTGVLTLVRGLRRGELRFFEGEVTSAQVGVLHGLAALHQLLLWTKSRFEFRRESVVRRRQIPLSQADVLVDCERFLQEIKEVAGTISPSHVYRPETDVISAVLDEIPSEVHPVVRLFDGSRTIADVIEDSPYRVFESLRIAQRLIDMGVISQVAGAVDPTPRAVLAIEEWLVGGVQAAVLAPMGGTVSEPIGPAVGQAASPPGHKAEAMDALPAISASEANERAASWAGILPAGTGRYELGPVSLVPSASASGEFVVSPVHSGAKGDEKEDAVIVVSREGLEDVTDSKQREQIFPREESSSAGRAAVQSVTIDKQVAEDAALREAQAIARRAIDQLARENAEGAAAPTNIAEAAERAVQAAQVPVDQTVLTSQFSAEELAEDEAVDVDLDDDAADDDAADDDAADDDVADDDVADDDAADDDVADDDAADDDAADDDVGEDAAKAIARARAAGASDEVIVALAESHRETSGAIAAAKAAGASTATLAALAEAAALNEDVDESPADDVMEEAVGEGSAETSNAGDDAAGDDAAGEDEAGEDEAGEDEAGEDEAGEDEAGEDEAGEDEAGEDEAGEDEAGEDEAGEDEAGEDEAGEDEAGEDEAGEDAAGDDAAGDDAADDDAVGDDAVDEAGDDAADEDAADEDAVDEDVTDENANATEDTNSTEVAITAAAADATDIVDTAADGVDAADDADAAEDDAAEDDAADDAADDDDDAADDAADDDATDDDGFDVDVDDDAADDDVTSASDATVAFSPVSIATDAAAAVQVALAAQHAAGPATASSSTMSVADPRAIAANDAMRVVSDVAVAGKSVTVFSDEEEAFFSAGHKLASQPAPLIESFDDLDDDYEHKTFWQRLVSPTGSSSKARTKGVKPEQAPSTPTKAVRKSSGSKKKRKKKGWRPS